MGNSINTPIATAKEKIIDKVIIILSIFSPKTFFKKASNLLSLLSSSSSKKLAENLKLLLPTTIESINTKTPLTKGILRTLNFFASPSYVSFSTAIVPSGFLTAVA